MKYVMLTQKGCKYCILAEDLLKEHGHTVDKYDVQDPSMSLLVKMLIRSKTVPQIFAPDGSYIGGYTELKELLSE